MSFLTPDKKILKVFDVTVDPPAATDHAMPVGTLSAEWHPTEPALALVVASGDAAQRVVLWDVAGAKPRAACGGELPFPSNRLSATAFSPDGRWLAVSPRLTSDVYLFDTRSGVDAGHLPDAATFGIDRIFWTAGGELATAGLLERVRFWAVTDAGPVRSFDRLRLIDHFAFGPDGRTVVGFAPTGRKAPAGMAAFWFFGPRDRPDEFRDRAAVCDLRTGTVTRHLTGFDAVDAVGIAVSPDGRQVALARDEELLVRDIVTGNEVLRRPPPKKDGGYRWSRIFYRPAGTLIGLLERLKDGPHHVLFWDVAADQSPWPDSDLARADLKMGREILVPAGGRVCLYATAVDDPEPGREQKPIPPPRLYDLATGRLLRECSPLNVSVGEISEAIQLSPQRRTDPRDEHERAENVNHGLPKDDFYKDSYWIVRDLATGAEIVRTPMTTSADQACDFSPDGRYVAVGSIRGYVELWDLDIKSLVFRWQPHGGKMASARRLRSPTGPSATLSDADDTVSRTSSTFGTLREQLEEAWPRLVSGATHRPHATRLGKQVLSEQPNASAGTFPHRRCRS